MRLSSAALVRAAVEPVEGMWAFVPGDSGLSCRTKGPPLALRVAAGAIAAGGAGASEALTRNPADVKKIANKNTNMEFASQVLVAGPGERTGDPFSTYMLYKNGVETRHHFTPPQPLRRYWKRRSSGHPALLTGCSTCLVGLLPATFSSHGFRLKARCPSRSP